ncbi:MAG: hypothetical protein ACRDQ2_03965, partial [Gaiellales bacterium]
MVLLGPDRLGRLGTEGDELLGADLAVGEAQARPAYAVLDDGVEDEVAGVPAPHAGLHEHDHEVADRRVANAGQVRLGFQLRHHELRDEAGQRVGGAAHLLPVDDGVGGETVEPPAPFEEHLQERQRVRAGRDREGARRHPRQVVDQQITADPGGVAHLGMAFRQEQREAGQSLGAGFDAGEGVARREPEAGPPLDLLSQPPLADHPEVGDVAAPPGGDPQPAGVPLVTD